MRLPILLLALSSTTVEASDIISCEARDAGGNHEDVIYDIYDKIYPTIIISEASNSVTYVYLRHGQQWSSTYNIKLQNERFLLGVEQFDETQVSFFHYDKRENTFNIVWSADSLETLGNTFTIGKCFN